MWFLNKEKNCEVCNVDVLKKELYYFGEYENDKIKTIKLCKNCFLNKIEKSIKEYNYKALAVQPLLKSQDESNSYQFFGISKMDEWGFDDENIGNAKDIISKSKLKCDNCDKERINFIWVSSEINEFKCCSLSIMNDEKIQKNNLCSDCMSHKFISRLNNLETIDIKHFLDLPKDEDSYGSAFEF